MEQDSVMLPVVADTGGESVSLGIPPPSRTVYDADYMVSHVLNDVDMTEGMPSLGGSQATPQDRELSSPTLLVLSTWRTMSTIPPEYACSRLPETGKYQCTLTLSHSSSSMKHEIKTPPDYANARDAKAAASRLVIESGLLNRASQTADMAISAIELPRIQDVHVNAQSSSISKSGPSTTPAQPSSMASKSMDAVSRLNLAIQRYCAEPPSAALTYIEQPHQPSNDLNTPRAARLRLCRYTLRCRITSDVHEQYTTADVFASTKAAKEAVAQLAIDEGVLSLIKLHNSITTKVCQQLGLAVPPRVEDHDVLDEENTAGRVSIAVQKATRDPSAIECEWSEVATDFAILHGARMTVRLGSDDIRIYEMDPVLRSRKEAKEAVCRLVVKKGLLQDLERHHILPSVASIAAQATANQDALQQSAITRLNLCVQANHNKGVSMTYDFQEHHNRPAMGRASGSSFTCTAKITRDGVCVRQFTNNNLYPSKQQAKEHTAEAAIQQGAIQALAGSLEPMEAPPLNSASGIQPESTFPACTYAATSNGRVRPAVSTAQDDFSPSPPSYSESLLVPTQPEQTATSQMGPPPRATRNTDPYVPSGVYDPGTTQQPQLSTQPAAETVWIDFRSTPHPQDRINEAPKTQYLHSILAKHLPTTSVKNLQMITQRNVDGGHQASLQLWKDQECLHETHIRDSRGTTQHLEESLASKALDAQIEKVIMDHWPADVDRLNGASVPPAAAKARPDAASTSVSTLESIFSVLFGNEGIKPVYELLREEGGTLFGAILTLPLQNQRIFKVDCLYPSKQLAKAQVAQQALDDGAAEDAKSFWLQRQTGQLQSQTSREFQHATSHANEFTSADWLGGTFSRPKRQRA